LSKVRSATVTEPRSSLPQTQKEQAGVNAGQNLTPKKNKAGVNAGQNLTPKKNKAGVNAGQNLTSKKNKAGSNAGLVLFDAVRSPLQERIAVNVAGLSMMILLP
jgi:hypothetical protein